MAQVIYRNASICAPQLCPGWDKPHYRLASAREALEEWEAAANSYQAALDINPEDQVGFARLKIHT